MFVHPGVCSKQGVAVGASREIVALGPGLRARIHHRLCWLTVTALGRINHRGLRFALRLLGSIFGLSNYAVFRVFEGKQVRVFLTDRYWLPVLLSRAPYEPEVEFVLSRVLTQESVFVDLGANIGWWSIFASTRIRSRKKILAIEASPSVFTQLVENGRLNEDAYRSVNAAIWNVTDVRLTVASEKGLHESASVKLRKNRERRDLRMEAVQSLTLDDAVGRYLATGAKHLIVKLDVEGAEIEALEGARVCLSAIDLVIYEDHGSEPEAKVTRRLLELGFCIFWCDPCARIRKVRDAEAAQSVKLSPAIGYNFFAARPHSTPYHLLTAVADSVDVEGISIRDRSRHLDAPRSQ